MFNEDEVVDLVWIEVILVDYLEIIYFVIVYSEMIIGIFNLIEVLMFIMYEYGIVMIIDVMFSLGGVLISIDELDCDYLISSVNKCV